MKWESKAAPESKSESESELELELNQEKTLYLSFSEVNQCGNVEYRNQVIRPIKLSHVLSTTTTTTTTNDDDDAVEELGEAAYKRSRLNLYITNCSRFGSQILLAGGLSRAGLNIWDRNVINREILWFDTCDPNPKFEVSSSSSKSKIKSFTRGKNVVRLGELDGKLYCIGSNLSQNLPCLSPRENFEVFDPTEDDPKWRPLDAPPPFISGEDHFFKAAFVGGSKKILGWKSKKPGVVCFDVNRPEKGWIESPSCFGNLIPFLRKGAPFFIHHRYDGPNKLPGDDGGFEVMFTYDPKNAPQIVPVFLMSKNCDSLQPMGKPLKLPKLPYEFQTEALNDTSSTQFEFVHLGDHKVCLVLHKFFYPRSYFPEDARSYWSNKKERKYKQRNKASVLLVTFEYDIISTTAQSSFDVQCRLLGTRSFQYFTKQMRKPDPTETRVAILNGAFLL